MSAHPDPTTETDDAFVRECEFRSLRRLAKLTESENERVALRACEVLLRHAHQRRRDEARQTSASGGRKPPVPEKPREAKPQEKPQEGTGGLRPPLAEGKKIPHALLHSPKPVPAFRAIPPGTVIDDALKLNGAP